MELNSNTHHHVEKNKRVTFQSDILNL